MLNAAEHLVQEIRHALVVQVHLDHLAQIRIHQLHHQVHVLKLIQRPLRRERVEKANYLQSVTTLRVSRTADLLDLLVLFRFTVKR